MGKSSGIYYLNYVPRVIKLKTYQKVHCIFKTVMSLMCFYLSTVKFTQWNITVHCAKICEDDLLLGFIS